MAFQGRKLAAEMYHKQFEKMLHDRDIWHAIWTYQVFWNTNSSTWGDCLPLRVRPIDSDLEGDPFQACDKAC